MRLSEGKKCAIVYVTCWAAVASAAIVQLSIRTLFDEPPIPPGRSGIKFPIITYDSNSPPAIIPEWRYCGPWPEIIPPYLNTNSHDYTNR